MILKEVTIVNYKCFFNRTIINFQPGINIIVGKNNAGKSTLLESLSLKIPDKPHVSIKSKPQNITNINNNSDISGIITVPKDKLVNYLKNNVFEKSFLSLSTSIQESQYINFFNNNDRFDIRFNIKKNLIITHEFINAPDGMNDTGRGRCTRVFLGEDRLRFETPSYSGFSPNQILSFQFVENFRTYSYIFKSERFNIGSCKFGNSGLLKNDASNLPEVISVLQSSNPSRYEKYVRMVKEIFPEIYDVRAINKDNGNVEIVLWTIDPNTERRDLVIPLSESGTGISQVLAIIYVIINNEFPSMIAIDEPNTFLHPGAVRKLMNILNINSEHQYIISTHSPVVLSSFENPSIIQLQIKNYEPDITYLNKENISELKHVLNNIGVKLSDIFGADNIIWVEGPTEEKCFEYINKKLTLFPFNNTQFCAVKSTDELLGKKIRLIFGIYEKLSGGNRILPPAIAFIFDNENKSSDLIEDIKRRSDNKAHFLKRKMYENYIIHPEAIAAVINGKILSEDPITPISAENIDEWIDKNKSNEEIIKCSNSEVATQDAWLCKVDGANLLSTMYKELTDHKIIYDKTDDSVEITKWLLENNIIVLNSLIEELKSILN